MKRIVLDRNDFNGCYVELFEQNDKYSAYLEVPGGIAAGILAATDSKEEAIANAKLKADMWYLYQHKHLPGIQPMGKEDYKVGG